MVTNDQNCCPPELGADLCAPGLPPCVQHKQLSGDMRDVLVELGLEDYEGAFERNRVKLSDLYLLTEADFEALVPQIGPRRRLRAFSHYLAKKQKAASAEEEEPQFKGGHSLRDILRGFVSLTTGRG